MCAFVRPSVRPFAPRAGPQKSLDSRGDWLFLGALPGFRRLLEIRWIRGEGLRQPAAEAMKSSISNRGDGSEQHAARAMKSMISCHGNM